MMRVKTLLASYNGEKYIKDQINTILIQKNVNVEIVISDDNSTDNTFDIVRSSFPTIPISVNSPGTGSAAKNFLKMVSNLNFEESFEYVAFSDQDDIWLPKKLSSAIDLLNSTNSHLYCSNLTKWDTSNNSYIELKKDFPQTKFDYLFEGGSAGCTYVFTKELAYQFKIFLESVDYSNWKDLSHDWLVYWFARLRDFKVMIDGNSYIEYRLHNENVHGHLNKLNWSAIKEKCSQVLSGYYQNHAKNYIKYVPKDSEEYYIYSRFLKGYFSRNYVILKYNIELMRDKKKFMIFALLNLLKFK